MSDSLRCGGITSGGTDRWMDRLFMKASDTGFRFGAIPTPLVIPTTILHTLSPKKRRIGPIAGLRRTRPSETSGDRSQMILRGSSLPSFPCYPQNGRSIVLVCQILLSDHLSPGSVAVPIRASMGSNSHRPDKVIESTQSSVALRAAQQARLLRAANALDTVFPPCHTPFA